MSPGVSVGSTIASEKLLIREEESLEELEIVKEEHCYVSNVDDECSSVSSSDEES